MRCVWVRAGAWVHWLLCGCWLACCCRKKSRYRAIPGTFGQFNLLVRRAGVEVGPQLGHQVPGRLPLRCGRPCHRSGSRLRLHLQLLTPIILRLASMPFAHASARQFLDESQAVSHHTPGVGAGAELLLPS